MKKRRFKKLKIFASAVLLILLAFFSFSVIKNRLHAEYEDLNETDRFILQEFDSYCKGTKENDIWPGFALGSKTVLAVDDSSHTAYLLNPETKVNSIFARKITMPSDSDLEVYRISSISPSLFSLRFDGNFNSTEETYQLYGSNIYYTKYNNPDSMTKPFSSEHYITFLSHEAFHYYMQKNWAFGSTYSTDMMSEHDRKLLYEEYKVLSEIQTALLKNTSDRAVFLQYARDYRDAVKKRLESNPEYVNLELARETTEGTATYVGIKASEITGYDFGVMYFDNAKNIPFSGLENDVESGLFQKRFLADRIPYETGALLCLLMDELEIPDWKETLNSQTEENHITLYSIINDFLEA